MSDSEGAPKPKFTIINPETELKPGPEPDSELTLLNPDSDPDAFSEEEDGFTQHQHLPPRASTTDTPLREQLSIVAAFMVLVFLLILLFERTSTNKYDPGTGNRPGLNEGVVPNQFFGGAPQKAPWK